MNELSPYYESVDNGYRQLSYKEVIEGLQQEIERLKEENTILKQTMSSNSLLINENAFLKERIDKAIEYIYLHSTQRKWFADISDRLHNQEIQFKGRIQDLLDILKGDDKE